MGLTLLILTLCLLVGAIAAVATHRPRIIPEIGEGLKNLDTVKQFSPKNTLFIIGPDAEHHACRMQRRLLKPAIATFIREDVSVIEVYGSGQPRRNGEKIDWLDASLLRHALDAEDGFFIVYVDEAGKTLFRSEAPMVTIDILRKARIEIPAPRQNTGGAGNSSILDKLSAA